jgi:hypothetical protein
MLSTRFIGSCMLAVLVVLLPTAAQATIVYDAYNDFSTTVNTESSRWSYRYDDSSQTTRHAAPTLFSQFSQQYDGHFDPGPTLSSWNNGNSGWPAVFINNSGVEQEFYGVVTVPVGALFTAPQYVGSGGMTVVSWLAPGAGKVDVSMTGTMIQHATDGDGVFLAIDKNGFGVSGGGNIVSALVGAGYGNSQTIGMTNVSVAAGDRINFVVDRNNFATNDTTAFTAHIEFSPIPEPTTIMMLVSGIFGLLAYAWRKRK